MSKNKEVEMASYDEKGALRVGRTEVKTVKLKVRHKGIVGSGVRILSDVVAGRVVIEPGQEVDVEMSVQGADELKARTKAAIGDLEVVGVKAEVSEEVSGEVEYKDDDEDEDEEVEAGGTRKRLPRKKTSKS